MSESEPDLDLLRRLWWFSMHDDMPIWIAGQLQGLVREKLGGEDVDVDEALGNEIVELTRAEALEIRERNRRIRAGEERV